MDAAKSAAPFNLIVRCMKNIIKTIGVSFIVSMALSGAYSVVTVKQIHAQSGLIESGSVFSDPIYWGVFTSQMFWLFTASLLASIMVAKVGKTSNKGN